MWRCLVATLLAVGVAPVPAAAAAGDTRFAVITTTQGPAVPDRADAFIARYEADRRRYGGGPIGIRVFSRTGLPRPGAPGMEGRLLAWAARSHADELITISHRVPDPAGLPALLDWARTHHLRVSVIYFHEPQEDWYDDHNPDAEPGRYRAVYRDYRRIIAAHPAAPQVTLEKNLTWYWQHHKAARRGGDWHRYVEPHDPADLLSWDTYVFPGVRKDQERYSTPDEFFRYARDAWNEFRLPWAVGEIGTEVQDGPGADRHWDPRGTKFAAWVTQITEAARNPATMGPTYVGMPPARFVKWWAGPDRYGNDQSLEQVPAAVATYRNLVRSFPL